MANMAGLTLRLAVGLTIVKITAAYPTGSVASPFVTDVDCASRSFQHPEHGLILCTAMCNINRSSSDQRLFCIKNCPGFYEDCGGEPEQVPLSPLQPPITASTTSKDLVHPANLATLSEPADFIHSPSDVDGDAARPGEWSIVWYIVLPVIGVCIVVIVVGLILVCKKCKHGTKRPAQETGSPDPSKLPMIPHVVPSQQLQQ